MFNQPITDFYLGKRLLFINISNKVVLFDFPTLTYIKSVINIASNKYQLIDIKQFPRKEYQDFVLMAKISCENFNIINVFEYKSLSNTQKHSEITQDIAVKEFDFIKLLYIDPVSNMLIVCSNYGNKVHLYTINNNKYTFLTCIYLGNNIYEVSNFAFDIKNKYVGFLIDSQEIFLYKLSKLKPICNCKIHIDSIAVKKKSNKGGIMDMINKSISGITSTYSKYNLGHTDNILLLCFDINTKKLLNVINKNGQVMKLKMNRKNQPSLKKESTLFLFD